MKTVLILQPFGLGDVIWSQTIANHFLGEGHNVLWPVKEHYVDACQKAYPKICFIADAAIRPDLFDIKEKIESNGMLISPIRWSNSFMKVPYAKVMMAKFMMYDIPWQDWKLHAGWRRDADKENQLMRHLGILPGEKFNLINKRFGTNGDRFVGISVSNQYKNIELVEVPGYSLFDWSRMIQLASEIHTVSTSILYMLEILPLTANSVHLYVREGLEKDFSFVDYIFTKDYKLHV